MVVAASVTEARELVGTRGVTYLGAVSAETASEVLPEREGKLAPEALRPGDELWVPSRTPSGSAYYARYAVVE